MASYHTDCHICGRKKWHDAIPGQEIKTYCPTCEPKKKRTAHDDVPPQSQRIKKGGGAMQTVESKDHLPMTGAAAVGDMRVVTNEAKVYCYINQSVGWMEVGTADDATEVILGKETVTKDKKNNRREAIEATKRKRAERERESREG